MSCVAAVHKEADRAGPQTMRREKRRKDGEAGTRAHGSQRGGAREDSHPRAQAFWSLPKPPTLVIFGFHEIILYPSSKAPVLFMLSHVCMYMYKYPSFIFV